MIVSLENWVESDKRQFRLKRYRKSQDGAFGIQDALAGETGMIPTITNEYKEDIFYMLMFCLCVPQSRAIQAGEAIEILKKHDFYHKDIPLSRLISILQGRVRFHNTKAKRLLDAKAVFLKTPFWNGLKKFFDRYQSVAANAKLDVLRSARVWLMKQINGLAMKGSSHLLRNIGMRGLAILDVHVLNQMHKRGLVGGHIKMNRSKYEELEQIELDYAEKVGIEVDELDLLWWSGQTGYVYK